jgi:hypothetical protein
MNTLPFSISITQGSLVILYRERYRAFHSLVNHTDRQLTIFDQYLAKLVVGWILQKGNFVRQIDE